MTRLGPGGTGAVSSPSRDACGRLAPPPLPHEEQTWLQKHTGQVSSQGHKGAALFSVCSNQAGLQGEKVGLQSSSSPLTPYLSNLTLQRPQKEVIGLSRNTKMAHEHRNGRECIRPSLPGGKAPCRKWVSLECLLLWNTLPWQLNNFLFLLVILHLLNHRFSRSL